MTPANFLSDNDMSADDVSSQKNIPGISQIDNDQNPAILIGNFGDGRINVYTLDGHFRGQLQKHKQTIAIDGLWALSFAPTTATAIDPMRLYFSAGPKDETDGLFGYLIKK